MDRNPLVRPLRRPAPGEKVYRLSEEEASQIRSLRARRTELDPGMGGVSPALIRRWMSEGALLTSLDIMLTRQCNFACGYCYAEAGAVKEKLPFALIERVVRECPDVGVRMMVVTGGEPLLYRDAGKGFMDVAELVLGIYVSAAREIVLSVFSDVALITPEIARRLYDLKVALCLKRDSLDRGIQDRLLGTPGGMARMEVGYQNLFEVGYGGQNSPPITVNSVFNVDTMHGMIRLHRWVRSHGMEHSIVPVHYCGRAEGDDQPSGITAFHVKVLYDLLSEIDAKEFNDPWHPFSAFPKNKTCNRNISGAHLRSNGLLAACSESPDLDDYIFGDVRKQSLSEIVHGEKMRRFREEFPKGCGEYICNPEACDLNALDLCRGGCATRSAYSRFDPDTGRIVPAPNLRGYIHRREDPLCPAWARLAEIQGCIRPGLMESLKEALLLHQDKS